MLKYKVRVSKDNICNKYGDTSPSSVSHIPSNLIRSSSLLSISSLENSNCDWGPLKIDVSAVNQYSQYKTIRVSHTQNVSYIIPLLISKLKLPINCQYDMWMEVKTRSEGSFIISSLCLNNDSRPLELEKCLPDGMSRFILLPK